MRILLFLLCLIAGSTSAQPITRDFILGKVETLHSIILNEDRVLNVYLPEGYNDTTKYPVIYLLDGGADEDFIHTVGLLQYFTFPWINRVPPSIVVGIANTNRKRDFTFSSKAERYSKLVPANGGSSAFISFVENELQPFIEKKYAAGPGKTIIGQSLGGLLATEILFTKPALFNQYIIISPSLWWDDGSLLKRKPAILEAGYNRATSIYIGVGEEGSIDGSKEHVMKEDAMLLAEKIKSTKSKSVKVYFDYMPAENHATSSHPAMFNAFKLLYPEAK